MAHRPQSLPGSPGPFQRRGPVPTPPEGNHRAPARPPRFAPPHRALNHMIHRGPLRPPAPLTVQGRAVRLVPELLRPRRRRQPGALPPPLQSGAIRRSQPGAVRRSPLLVAVAHHAARRRAAPPTPAPSSAPSSSPSACRRLLGPTAAAFPRRRGRLCGPHFPRGGTRVRRFRPRAEGPPRRHVVARPVRHGTGTAGGARTGPRIGIGPGRGGSGPCNARPAAPRLLPPSEKNAGRARPLRAARARRLRSPPQYFLCANRSQQGRFCISRRQKSL